jgi:hypothetical protein
MDIATWTWLGAEPDQWGFYIVGSVVPGMEWDVEPAGSRTANLGPLTGQDVVLVGVDFGFTTFQTPPSNDVVVP